MSSGGQHASDGARRRLYDRKVESYQDSVTPDVSEAVSACLPTGGRLLDIGCGTGNLLAQFKDQASWRAGIELSARACSAAREVADEVVNASIESDAFPFDPRSFDVVVCADVIEHLADPGVALAKAVRWCRSGGAVVVSVPNIAYWKSRIRLMKGTWKYEDVGIFDDTHLRFFTGVSLRSLLKEHGLEVTEYRPVLLPFWPNLRGFRRLPRPIQQPLERAWLQAGRWRPSLFAYQHVCTCRLLPS